MELQVTLTLSDRLFTLLEDKLPNLGRRIEKAVTKEIGAQARQESNIEIPASVDAVAETPQPTVEPARIEPLQQPEKVLTAEDARAIMHRTRQRFEGADYKDNADSDGYKKYHKQLTGMFKQIAAVLGADKPSALPTDKIAAFAVECDALIIDDKGYIAPPPAPF